MSGEQLAKEQKSAGISHAIAQRLLILFSVIFALWIAGLVAMYFTTVYPQHHSAATTNR
jgi:hypothetical protein